MSATLRMDTPAFERMFSEAEQSAIIDAIEFYIEYLDLEHRVDNISFLPLEYIDGVTYTMGSCDHEPGKTDHSYVIDFVGLAEKEAGRNLAAVLTTIAHEIIHVKHYVLDNLDEAYKLNQMAGKKKIPYSETWWEKEAFGRQEELLLAFIEKISRD